MEKQLHDLTEDEVIELISIAKLMDNDILRNNEEDINIAAEHGMLSKNKLVGKKYLFYKTFSPVKENEQEIYFLQKWESRGPEDSDSGVHPYTIKIGFVSGMYGDYHQTLDTIEWFLSKGFRVGNLKTNLDFSFPVKVEEWIQWTKENFSKATAESSLVHLQREIKEVLRELNADEPSPRQDGNVMTLIEYADCILCLLTSAGKSGLSYDQIMRAIQNKININYTREWKFNPEDNTYSHVKKVL